MATACSTSPTHSRNSFTVLTTVSLYKLHLHCREGGSAMAFCHIALATGDLEATHRFYTEAMGFGLVHVEAADTDVPGSWLRHAFYDTGDGTLLAFQELHDDDRFLGRDFAISRGLGLPTWVNHLAFRVADLPALDAARDRWLRSGCDVVGMRHTHGQSIYADDPNGNVV